MKTSWVMGARVYRNMVAARFYHWRSGMIIVGRAIERGRVADPPLRFCGRIIENAAAGFASEAAGFYVLLQQRRGAVFIAQSFVEIFKDGEAHVESDEIHQFKRAHRMIQAELQGFINIGGGGDSFFEHEESFVANHGVDAAGDESRRFANDYNFFGHACADFATGGDGVFGSFQSADDFEQFHFRNGIKEMESYTFFGTAGDGG